MRVHFFIPDELVEAVDDMVGPRKRSEFVTEAVNKEVRRRKLLASAKKAAGSLKDVDIPGWETSESAAKWVHDLRRQSDRKLNWE